MPGLYDPSLDEISIGPIGPQGDVGEMGPIGKSILIIVTHTSNTSI